jgi:hypothetical protein
MTRSALSSASIGIRVAALTLMKAMSTPSLRATSRPLWGA